MNATVAEVVNLKSEVRKDVSNTLDEGKPSTIAAGQHSSAQTTGISPAVIVPAGSLAPVGGPQVGAHPVGDESPSGDTQPGEAPVPSPADLDSQSGSGDNNSSEPESTPEPVIPQAPTEPAPSAKVPEGGEAPKEGDAGGEAPGDNPSTQVQPGSSETDNKGKEGGLDIASSPVEGLSTPSATDSTPRKTAVKKRKTSSGKRHTSEQSREGSDKPPTQVEVEVESDLDRHLREIKERQSELDGCDSKLTRYQGAFGRLCRMGSELGRRGLELRIGIGEHIHGVKEIVGHGKFEKCLQKKLGIKPRTARDYIQIYDGRDRLRAEADRLLKSAESAGLTSPLRLTNSWAQKFLRKKDPSADADSTHNGSGDGAGEGAGTPDGSILPEEETFDENAIEVETNPDSPNGRSATPQKPESVAVVAEREDSVSKGAPYQGGQGDTQAAKPLGQGSGTPEMEFTLADGRKVRCPEGILSEKQLTEALEGIASTKYMCNREVIAFAQGIFLRVAKGAIWAIRKDCSPRDLPAYLDAWDLTRELLDEAARQARQ